MSLQHYHKKRNFAKTPEPQGKVTQDNPRLFVVQKHAASHLHYDFRLELKGVLKSWAIPKGPSLDPKIKRLAIQVEDHPIEYGSFEGIIPKGQYGGGTVMLWDEGSWEPLDNKPYEAYQKGHLRFNLHAHKLQGRWDLIRFKDEKHWFLIKYQDDYAQSAYDLTEELTKSIKSNRSMDEISADDKQISQGTGVKSAKKKIRTAIHSQDLILPKGLRKRPFPKFIPPQLATLVDQPPEGSLWAHEIKFDGYRVLAFKRGSEVTLKSRNNKDWTVALESIAEAISLLPFDTLVLDGEVVVLDAKGRSNFQLLQNSIKNKEQALNYFIFDLLYFESYDLCTLSLEARKGFLKKILNVGIPQLNYSEHIVQEGLALYHYSCKQGLEGIVSKRLDKPYVSKRGKDWLKIKCIQEQEFVIGGYSPPKGGRAHFGSLYLGVYNKEGSLDYAGNVGTGFNAQSLNEINQLLLKNRAKTNPFNSKPPGSSTASWLDPQLVCQVAFSEWTKEGHLRHPSFQGLRSDKKALEVLRESALPLERGEGAVDKCSITRTKLREVESRDECQPPLEKKTSFTLTHPNKILYPEDEISKKDLLDYYESVVEYILPYLRLRPLTLVRCPAKYTKCFFQRHYNKTMGKNLYPLKDLKDKDEAPYLYLKDQEGLFQLVQMAVLEIHPWGSTRDSLEKPDIIIIDLDPAPELPWAKVVHAALDIRAHFMQYKLQSFVKTTGGKGLHVVVPILPEYNWEEVKSFTQVFVQCLEKINPKLFISTMSKTKRRGKIFIDYLRNQRTATAVGPYSTRARPHAPVATPLSWDELCSKKEQNSYTIKTLAYRLKHLKEDPWGDFWRIKQSLRLV